MEKLLQKYCELNSLSVDEMKSDSREKGLPRHRHIFAYCIRKRFPTIKLWQIGKVLQMAQIHYGVKIIRALLKSNPKIRKIPPEVMVAKTRIKTFLAVLEKYNRTDIILPGKDD